LITIDCEKKSPWSHFKSIIILCLIETIVTIPLPEYQELKYILKVQSKQIEALQADYQQAKETAVQRITKTFNAK
jgi:hypothetical protein